MAGLNIAEVFRVANRIALAIAPVVLVRGYAAIYSYIDGSECVS